MHPGNPQPTDSAPQPAAGWPPGSAGHAQPPTPPPAAPAVRRARVGVIALVSMLSCLVLIAAGANQWVSNYVVRHTADSSDKFIVRTMYAGLTYQWRFRARGGDDRGHLVLAQFVLIAVVLVGTGLLVFAIARGAVTFGRVFVGTWLSVIVATQLGAIVRGFVVDRVVFGATQESRPVFAVYGSIAPSAPTFVGGVGLGLLVGLISALAAVISRRRVGVLVPAPAVGTFGAPPSGAGPSGAGPWGAGPSGDAQQTRQFAAVPSTGQPGERPNLEKSDRSPGAGPAAAGAGAASAAGGAAVTHRSDQDPRADADDGHPGSPDDGHPDGDQQTQAFVPADRADARGGESPGAQPIDPATDAPGGQSTDQTPDPATEDPQRTQQFPRVDPGSAESDAERTTQLPPVREDPHSS